MPERGLTVPNPSPLPRRLTHAWAVLCGHIILPAQIEEMTVMAELTKTAASLAALSSAVGRLITQSQTDATNAADVNATLSTVDDSTSQQIDAIVGQINAVAPEPVADGAAVTEPAGNPAV